MRDKSLAVGEYSEERIRTFLKSEGADRPPAGDLSTLYEHLLNTREIVRSWSQPDWLQTAAAIHSIYSSESHGDALVPLSARGKVAELAGQKAERLAWLFCSVSLKDMLQKLELGGAIAADGFSLRAHAGGEETVLVSRDEIFCLVILCMANEAEQTRDKEGRPRSWLARVSAWGRFLAGGPETLPPIFNYCRETVDLQSERAARDFWLLALESVCRDLNLADSQFTAASRRCRWIAEPLIGAACVASWQGDNTRARQLAGEAAGLLRQWGTAWEKRVPFADWLNIAEALIRSDEPPAAPVPNGPQAGWWIAGRNLSPSPPVSRSIANRSGNDPAASRLEGYFALFAAGHQRPLMALYPGLPSKPWYDAADFAVARDLEAHFEAIRQEVLNLDRHAFHAEREGLLRAGAWDVFMLYELGRTIPENCALCPVTTRVVERHANVRKAPGIVYFSRMSPGTHINPHRGTTNMRVRCHLGLEVPAGDCAMRVGTEIRPWQRGRAIVFDDFFEHEVWNRTSEDRIVLIVDLWHPELTSREIAVLEGMQRFAFMHAKTICSYWEGNESARAAARKQFA